MQNDEIKKIKSAHKLLTISVIAALLSGLLFFAITSQNHNQTLKIGQNKLTIEIATTSQEKQHGLCCRSSLPENHAMLFVFTEPGIHRFWMKDTQIPLDMYWINAKKQIIFIQKNVQLSSFPSSFGPSTPAQYVLETNAGYATKHDIKIGDTVDF